MTLKNSYSTPFYFSFASCYLFIQIFNNLIFYATCLYYPLLYKNNSPTRKKEREPLILPSNYTFWFFWNDKSLGWWKIKRIKMKKFRNISYFLQKMYWRVDNTRFTWVDSIDVYNFWELEKIFGIFYGWKSS